MNEWLKIVIPVLALLVAFMYSEIRKLDREIMSKDLILWRLEQLEKP